MNGFKYEQRVVNLPEPKPEPRKAPPCPDCLWWYNGRCIGEINRHFTCFEDTK